MKKLRWFLISFFIVLTILNFWIEFYYSQFIYSDIPSLPDHEFGLVLGASVKEGQPSAILKNRLDGAIRLYRESKIQKVLLSGDNTKQKYREVDVMKNYLLDHQVSGSSILTDDHGGNTLSSIINSSSIVGKDGLTVITQKFHLSRALFLARRMGLSVHGYPAKGFSSKPRQLYHLGREFLARYLALWNVFSLGSGEATN